MRKPDLEFSPAALADVLFGELQLPETARLTVAYSGGLDSTVLVHALAALRATRRFTLAAIHIDHGLQAESPAWSARCAETCRQLDVPCRQRRVTVPATGGEGREAAARRVRYAALRELLAPGEFLLTAHQRDDQAETVLLQLLRGTGMAGLAAMPARSHFGAGELIRPLLEFPRQSLQAYALDRRLAWTDDPSNADIQLRRNFLRRDILPLIATHWPEATTALARSAGHAAEALALLDELAAADLAGCRCGDGRYPEALSITALNALSPARKRNLLRAWLRRQGFLAPSARHLEEVIAQTRHTPLSQQSCVSWPDAGVWRYRDCLVALPRRPLPDPQRMTDWDLAGPLEVAGFGRLRAVPSVSEEAPRLRPLARVRVRLRQGGEHLLLPGRTHHQALKKLIQAAGVPPWERVRLPLLYTDNRLAAVADRWVCAEFAAGRDEPGLQIIWEPFPEPGNLA